MVVKPVTASVPVPVLRPVLVLVPVLMPVLVLAPGSAMVMVVCYPAGCCGSPPVDQIWPSGIPARFSGPLLGRPATPPARFRFV